MGLGFVIQAYQKRCPQVVDWLVDLARRSGRRMMVRLVKGAYWDSEIKRAQLDGQSGYPVYTRKPYTDLAYIACARKLLAAPDAVYPQFATHNAQTLAAIYELAGPETYTPQQYEFQCLHGMGEPLYEQVVGPVSEGKLGRPCRIYAPVGTHETLLAYLVRRLLENGANTSFVNRIADQTISAGRAGARPGGRSGAHGGAGRQLGLPHPADSAAARCTARQRVNSRGLDLAERTGAGATGARRARDGGYAMVGAAAAGDGNAGRRVRGRAQSGRSRRRGRRSARGDGRRSRPGLAAGQAMPRRSGRRCRRPNAPRMLERRGRPPRSRHAALMGLLIREAGKSAPNAIAEVREAVDFLRYYAGRVRSISTTPRTVPLGPVVCISPWNFPLAIFVGQVSAALAAGNTVLAKPAEQTPLVAAEAVRVLWAAGVPRAALQLLPGRGEVVGAKLVADARVRGVLFTGSTDVARILQRTLAGRVDALGRAGAAGGRDRRPERDDRRLLGAGRTGGGRRAEFGLRQRRPALLGAARAVRAGGCRRPRAGDAAGRDGRTARRQSRPAGGGRRPGDRCRSARQHRAPHRADARQGPARHQVAGHGEDLGQGTFVPPT
jgi:RHH-type proline utilization regulon transcriptional repressor/proline dehydrogenase/delta 1-pyrroline-5-carboxylate dehydrogenase